MTVEAAEQDRYDKVVWVTIHVPRELLRARGHQRRFETDGQRRKRSAQAAGFTCRTCGRPFTSSSGRTQRRGRRVYARKFCSRACYARSIKGNGFHKADISLQGGEQT
ncbi:MAG: hypothetical protein WC728_03925 [Elusimicrobiota bacterium]